MALFVFRSGIPVAVPADYADDPQHRALVERLSQTNQYADAVAILEQHPDSFLAADVLTGAPWAQRFLNTTARLYQIDRRTARHGVRALLLVLNGTKPRTGRHRKPPLSPETIGHAVEVVTRWRDVVDACWEQERSTLLATLTREATQYFQFSRAHRRALALLLRRRTLRKGELVLTLASWETRLPTRRLRHSSMHPMLDFVYG
jgi:hypothetical protein